MARAIETALVIAAKSPLADLQESFCAQADKRPPVFRDLAPLPKAGGL